VKGTCGLFVVSIAIIHAQSVDKTSESHRPELTPVDIVSAANYASGSLTPGQVVILRTPNAGPEGLVESHLDLDGKMSTQAGETRVLFDDRPAPILYAVRGKIGVVVPYGIVGKETASVVVEYRGRRSDPVTLPVVPAAPALYTLDSSGRGQAAMLNETGCCNSARNPATQGSIAQLFGTGAGQVKPGGIDGLYSDYSQIADYPKPELPVSVTVGGIPAEILYAGEASLHVSGTFVVNFRVPRNAPVGEAIPLVLTVGSYRSPEGVTMAIRSVAQRVLIVERDGSVRQSLARSFQKAGADVRIAEDGQHALSLTSEQYPDLIVSDLDGNEAAIQKICSEHKQVKVILILKSTDPDELRAADLADAQAVFVKPIVDDRVVQRAMGLMAARASP
jgi:uncharacterized protein (TIGR03437 family)